MSKVSPLAVLRPLKTVPYQVAMPRSIAAFWAAIVRLGVNSGLAKGDAETEGGTLATGCRTCVSACTARVEMTTATRASTSEETPANSQIRSGAFRPGEPDLRRMTIPLCYGEKGRL